jgi:hypothetical protein
MGTLGSTKGWKRAGLLNVKWPGLPVNGVCISVCCQRDFIQTAINSFKSKTTWLKQVCLVGLAE